MSDKLSKIWHTHTHPHTHTHARTRTRTHKKCSQTDNLLGVPPYWTHWTLHHGFPLMVAPQRPAPLPWRPLLWWPATVFIGLMATQPQYLISPFGGWDNNQLTNPITMVLHCRRSVCKFTEIYRKYNKEIYTKEIQKSDVNRLTALFGI